ncbi:MAG: membrane protein insertase YidC [Planctomycetes bacterium]|nr:membrane protein insertase YidC [Planctomycetota bacterium]
MEPRKAPRWPILLLVLAAAAGVVLAAIYGPGTRKAQPAASPQAPPVTGAVDTAVPPQAQASAAPVAAAPATQAPSAAPTGLHARRPQRGVVAAPVSIGSLDPAQHRFRVDFSEGSAGISRVTFSDFWISAEAREQARAHAEAVRNGAAQVPPLPPDDQRYEVVAHGSLQGYDIPMLGARAVEVDGAPVGLFGAVWAPTGPGSFATEVASASGEALLRIDRSFSITDGGGGFDLRLAQSVRNLSDRALKVRWIQYGPADLPKEGTRPGRGGMLDIRRYQFGYLYGPQRDPQRQSVVVHGAMFDRTDVLKRTAADPTHSSILWPQPDQKAQGFELSWFGTTNRYFSLAVHAPDPAAAQGRVLVPVQEVWALADPTAASGTEQVAFTELRSGVVEIPAGGTAAFDMGAFPGPLDPRLLGSVEPFAALRMDGLILYLISGCCSFCTFSWLANVIVLVLTFLHDHVVFDWSLAIIVLVIVVRFLLHPVTRYSQIQMARVTKGMAAIKPELDALQKRYAGDPKRLQQEQMRLYREKGINPAGCVGGMLPTFLQMPIWIALYAVLYFDFDLWQKPAFFGVFQQFGGWRFLGDLSAPDHFIEFSAPLITWPFTFSGINLVPLLMGLLFWVQQKYLAPPTAANLSPEQQQQQVMMKWMSVILFPIMLYAAPSGLTVYIMTSTCIGIIEGKRIRRQIETMDLLAPRKRDPGKQDRLGKLYEAAMKRAQEKREQRGRRFKERD